MHNIAEMQDNAQGDWFHQFVEWDFLLLKLLRQCKNQCEYIQDG